MSDIHMGNAVWASDGGDDAVVCAVARHLDHEGTKHIALPGGTTPTSILASPAARALKWRGAEIWPTDERDVPPGHPANNSAMLSRALEGSGAIIHPLVADENPPPFDLVWLGVGMDGHIASIFPGMPLADDSPPTVVKAIPEPLPFEAPFARRTLTMRALADAREIIIVIRGEAKKAMLQSALIPGSDLPVCRFIRMAQSPVTVYWSAM